MATTGEIENAARQISALAEHPLVRQAVLGHLPSAEASNGHQDTTSQLSLESIDGVSEDSFDITPLGSDTFDTEPPATPSVSSGTDQLAALVARSCLELAASIEDVISAVDGKSRDDGIRRSYQAVIAPGLAVKRRDATTVSELSSSKSNASREDDFHGTDHNVENADKVSETAAREFLGGLSTFLKSSNMDNAKTQVTESQLIVKTNGNEQLKQILRTTAKMHLVLDIFAHMVFRASTAWRFKCLLGVLCVASIKHVKPLRYSVRDFMQMVMTLVKRVAIFLTVLGCSLGFLFVFLVFVVLAVLGSAQESRKLAKTR